MELKLVEIAIPEGANVIIGQAHFIKTAEDIYEAIRTGAPVAKFGVAFCEASGPCLVRSEGNDEALKKSAIGNALAIGAGHSFVIMMKDAFPLSVLNNVKACQEVVGVFCATANPVQVIVVQTGQGRGILGVVDGAGPAGIENGKDAQERRKFLRKIGYKL